MRQRDILLVIIPTFIMVVLWVAFSIYHNHISSTISEPLSLQIEPIGQSFDLNTLDNLKKRERLSPVYENISVESSEEITLEEEQETATSSSETTEDEVLLEEQPSEDEVLLEEEQ
ncbi:MAG: hypothetical protein UU21_C0004G0035 [Candidatus Levybacteria bacterium GW2011_GWA2_40_8]|nr:MAG: hypothetical protein UU21_C0004G0035 [Candidatus Levybacteria bacterium GW2011_GWA2_40_8]